MHSQLKLKQTQQLQLNPQLQQAIRLLQMSGVELEAAVEQALLENPLLERVENKTGADYGDAASHLHKNSDGDKLISVHRDDDAETMCVEEQWRTPSLTAEQALNGAVYESGFQDAFAQVEDCDDFRQYLRNQVCEHQLTPRQAFATQVLIEYLDEHGYLLADLTEIVEYSPLEWHLDEAILAEALELLKRFEPAGVGAANLQESLCLQLQRYTEGQTVQLAKLIVCQYFDVLSRPSSVTKLKKYLPASLADIQAAVLLIQSLNPYPNSGYAQAEPTQYVLPDIRVFKQGQRWQVQWLRGSQPQLRVNEQYATLAEQLAHGNLKKQVQDAKQLINGLAMRADTVLRVAEYVVNHQQAFFNHGSLALKPMLIKSVAKYLDLHESTISRAVNQKYLSCPQGLFELRWFFTQTATQGEGDDEEGISSRVIKTLIEKLITNEDKSRPLSDEKLSQCLLEHDIKIARRTVSKYRENLRIASASERKIRS